VSNSVSVYFDDFYIRHTQAAKGLQVMQTEEYYPGGATFNSYNKENSVANKRLYQTKEFQTDLELEQYDFGPRQYDPFIWRTTSHDPHAENYYDWSPYSWAFDNPIRYDDPSGRDPGDKVLGFAAALIDNAFGGFTNARSVAANYVDDAEDFNTGQDMGDVSSMIIGGMMVEGGSGASTGGTLVTVASGGLLGEVGVPVAVIGTGVAVEGVILGGSGAANLTTQKGRLEARQTDSGYSKTKHTDNRHVDRNKYPEKSKYSKPNQVNKINEKTMKKPDKVTLQKNGRVVYEKNMKRKIGTQGQTTNKVVTDPKKKKIVTSHPTN